MIWRYCLTLLPLVPIKSIRYLKNKKMTLDYHFNLKRFGYLLKRESFVNLKLFIIALGAISGILLIVFLVTVLQWDNQTGKLTDTRWDFHTYFFIPPYIIIGVLFTSLAYKDLLHVNKKYSYLTLPVSNFERLISMLLLTTVVYTALFIVYYFVLSLLLNGLGVIISPREFFLFDITAEPVVKAIKLYLVIQSIFLLGAAAFRRFPFLFTLLTLFLTAVALIVITLIAARIIFADYFVNNININFDGDISLDMENFLKNSVENLADAFWYVLAPFCWFITYLKLKEREV